MKDRKAWNSTLRPVSKKRRQEKDIKRPSISQLVSSGKVLKGNKEPTTRELIDILDDWWSQYIRLMHSDATGRTACFTCHESDHWKSMDCGHYMPRGPLNTRWDAFNTKPQCRYCNQIIENGNRNAFAINLDIMHGPGTAEQVKARHHQEFKPTRAWLIDKIKITKGIVAKLKAQRS